MEKAAGFWRTITALSANGKSKWMVCFVAFAFVAIGCELLDDEFDDTSFPRASESVDDQYEAENAATTSGCKKDSKHAGFTGTGFMDFGSNGTWIEFNNINVAQGGEFTLTFRYANGSASDRRAAVFVNGQKSGSLSFSKTGGWPSWKTDSLEASLRQGNNTVRISADTNSGGPNLDHMVVTGEVIVDNCPGDPNKTEPGKCGCGEPEGSCGGDSKRGLQATYFNNIDLTAQVLQRVDPTVNFDWGKGSPDSKVGANTFSARWTGFVRAKFSETYTFYTASDDGIRLSVNNKQIVNNWTNHSTTENRGTIALEAGQSYSIKLEYFENGGDAVAKLLWSSPSQSKQVVPQAQLSTSLSEDLCPDDPNKTEPGKCGCGVAEGTCTGPIITASGENLPREGKDKAFDGRTDTKWLAFADSAWVQYDYPGDTSVAVNEYRITSANDVPNRDPRDWRLLGSNNGTNWTTLDTRSGQKFSSRFKTNTYAFSNTTAYRMYRFDISSNLNPPAANSTQLAELELIEGSGNEDGTELCTVSNERSSGTLSCPSGETIVQIDFASYGLPTGSCDASFDVGTCHASSSQSKVEAACLSQHSCTVSASNGTFGDPCSGKAKRLAIEYTCGEGDVIKDLCPADPYKTNPGVCGCGVADIDSNSDGTYDCDENGDDDPDPSGELKIVVFSVNSADSALIIFPTGKTMMVDSATEARFESKVLPFLERHEIDHLDYYVETHPHPDHMGGRDRLISAGYIDDKTERWDWETHEYEDEFELEGTHWFIYNARDRSFHGTDANTNSLSFRIEYEGFVYSASGDEGVKSQKRMLADHPDLVPAHIRNTAHHMWGPVDRNFLLATDPYLFIISCTSSVREDSAFRNDFLWAVNRLKNNGGRLQEYGITAEVGHVIIRATDAETWSYDFCSNTNTCIIDDLQ